MFGSISFLVSMKFVLYIYEKAEKKKTIIIKNIKFIKLL